MKCFFVQAIRFSGPLSCCSSIRTLKTLVLTIHILLDRIASWRVGRGAIRVGSPAFANAGTSSTGATQAHAKPSRAIEALAARAESLDTLVPMLPQLRSHSASPEHHSALPLFARGARLWKWIPKFERMVVKRMVDWLRRNKLLPRGTHSPTAFRFVLRDRTLRERMIEERRRSSHLRLEPVRITRPTTPK